MRGLGLRASGFGLAILLAAASARAEAPRKITFRDAISVALAENPAIAIAKLGVTSAETHVSGTKAKMLPSVGVEAAGSLYTKAYRLDFGGMFFTLHDRETTGTIVTAQQPLTGLGYLSDLVGQTEHDEAAARSEYDRTRLDVAYRAAEAYLRVLDTRAAADIAHRSVADIQSELDRAIQFRQAETYTDIDVLRFRSAKAAADQNAVRADTAAQAAIARLAVQLGLHDGTALDVADDLPDQPPALSVALDVALEKAISARPELHAARERLESAKAQRKLAWDKYFPDVRAVGVWQHLTGVQPFQPENEEFLGLRLSWNVWDWGATHDSVKDADAAQQRAALEASALVDQVRLDVRERWLEAKAAHDSIEDARTQQQTADEALRLQKVRFDNAAATTTDVLDAETEAARARLRLAVTRYDYYLALVALARAVGDLPQP